MSNEVTIEQMNEVIARFDGWESRLQSKGQHSKTPLWYKVSAGYAAWDLTAMKYHTSWDWLMPVWVKWRRDAPITKEAEKWMDSLGYYLLTSDEPKRFCERLYYAIQWYNQQKQNNAIPKKDAT